MNVQLLQFHVKWLQLLGLWPESNHNILGVAHTLCVISSQLLNFLTNAANYIQCRFKLDCLLENITYTNITIAGIYAFLIFLFNNKTYQTLTERLIDSVHLFQTCTYTVAAEKLTRRVATACTIYCGIGLVAYGISPFIDYHTCLKRNNKAGALTCGLPTPGSFPFDTLSSPGYEVAFVFQCICAVLCIMSFVHPIMMCSSVVYHIIAQLKMLHNNLQKICDGEPKGRCKALRDCIAHHTALLDLTEMIAKPFNQLMLMHAILMPIIFSVLGFEMIQMFVTTFEQWNFSRYLIIFIGWYIILLCLSIVGQKLINESTAVAECAYGIPWYEESIAFQKMIWLIILRANKPLVLRSASISELSFASLAKVMSSTYSYLAMLYKVLLADQDDEVVLAG